MSFTEIIINILLLLVTITSSFVIYWLQVKHNKKNERINEERRQKDIENKAQIFLIEHEEDRNYLPWCIIAANQYPQKKHNRRIYTDFCRCSDELRTAILKNAQIRLPLIKEKIWVDGAIRCLIKDIDKYKLGNDYLYDNAKYFHRGFEKHAKASYSSNFERCFKPIYHNPKSLSPTSDMDDTLDLYMDEYFNFVLKVDRPYLQQENPIPPFDYVWKLKDLYNAPKEVDVCYWMMELVYNTVINIRCIEQERNPSDDSLNCDIFTDAEPQTFEDKYFDTLLCLYYTYINSSEMQKYFSEYNQKYGEGN